MLCTPARARLPAGVQQGRRRRHRLLPQARPQRAGHAGADPAADVQEDRGAPRHAQALRRQAGRAGRAAGRRRRTRWSRRYRAAMDAGKHTLDPVLTNYKSKYAVDWTPFLGKKWTDAADTALPLAELEAPGRAHHDACRPNFKVHPLVEKVLADRAAMGRGEINVDWGMGEHLAFASLVASGYAVRLSGEDCGARHLHAPPRGAARPEPREAGTRAPTCRCSTSPTARRRSSSSTRCCPKRRCSASSTATRAPSRTRW